MPNREHRLMQDRVKQYVERARRRGQRRRSGWNVVLAILVVVFAGFCGQALFLCVTVVQRVFWPEERFGETTSNVAEILMTVPLIFPAFGFGAIFANFTLWCIPPARRALERESRLFPETRFGPATRNLAWFTLLLCLIFLPLTLLGAADPFD